MTKKSSQKLPIFAEKQRILECIHSNPTVIIVGETGSGKTTQLPQFLHQAGYTSKGMIAITQPRRVAAISIATRVAQETHTKLGSLVGYSIRFEDHTSSQTLIKYMTDGMLLRELLSDDSLSKYTCIILDEAHERTLRTDILFGMLKRIQQKRPALKIIVMSATLNAKKFSAYFNNAPVIEVKGRQFPVEIYHSEEKQDDYLDAAIVSVFQIHQHEPAGDILVFLTGQEEIESAEKIINENALELSVECMKLITCPIYASMPTSMQTLVFEPAPPGTRKVILSTNIAETSITINGVKYVVDTGMSKVRAFNPVIGLETLSVVPISKASANQRTGRAGRLYTEASFNTLLQESEPEIKRVNLSSVILLLKASGVKDIVNFEYMDRPSRPACKQLSILMTEVIKALEELYALEALDDTGELSPIGKQMAEFPLDPTYAKLLLTSSKYNCTSAMIDIISMLSIDSPFFSSPSRREEQALTIKKFTHYEGDHLTLLNVLEAYMKEPTQEFCTANFLKRRNMSHVLQTRTQLTTLARKLSLLPSITSTSTSKESKDPQQMIKCLLTGFFMNIATLQQDGSYKLLNSKQQVFIHPSSGLFKRGCKCVVFGELVKTSRVYMRRCSVVEISWATEVAPHYYQLGNK